METLEVPPPSLSQLRLRASRFVSRDPEAPSDLGSTIRGGGGGRSLGSRRIGLKMYRASEAPKPERPPN